MPGLEEPGRLSWHRPFLVQCGIVDSDLAHPPIERSGDEGPALDFDICVSGKLCCVAGI